MSARGRRWWLFISHGLLVAALGGVLAYAIYLHAELGKARKDAEDRAAEIDYLMSERIESAEREMARAEKANQRLRELYSRIHELNKERPPEN